MKTKAKQKKPQYALYPVMLYTEAGDAIECLQYCRHGERPLSGNRRALAHFKDVEDAMTHYTRACQRPIPLLLLSAPVA